MADEKNMMPELTLTPDTAAAAEEVPTLTLEPSAPAAPAAPAPAAPAAAAPAAAALIADATPAVSTDAPTMTPAVMSVSLFTPIEKTSCF